ncbi:MAG: hypothetical protein JST80_12385 [Bdellovibrionales bacterium]|nr:hypothetical protein [Bdellovibrionales bacterium]
MNLVKQTKSLFILASIVMLSACGKDGKLNLKNVDLSTKVVSGQTYLNLDAQIVIGNLKFPNVEVPILNPKTMQSFGQMALANQGDGTNKLYLSIDFEQASRLDPNLGFMLPNGRELPLSLGASNTALIGIPILQKSRLYVGGDLHGDLYFGVAIVITAFDNVMNQVDIPLNIFTGFPFSNSVTGVAGLFTSPMPAQNGLALFVKKAANGTTQTLTANETQSLQGARLETGRLTPTAEAQVRSPSPTEIEHLNLYTRYRLNNLFNKKRTIKIQ